jgi:myo-inositol-1(or 4)-monophosphatase
VAVPEVGGPAAHGQLLHTGAGGLVAAADRQTHAALLEMIRNQAPPGW